MTTVWLFEPRSLVCVAGLPTSLQKPQIRGGALVGSEATLLPPPRVRGAVVCTSVPDPPSTRTARLYVDAPRPPANAVHRASTPTEMRCNARRLRPPSLPTAHERVSHREGRILRATQQGPRETSAFFSAIFDLDLDRERATNWGGEGLL